MKKITAQNIKDISIPEIDIIIPPLLTILDSAIKHNATLKLRKLDIDIKIAELKSNKTNWTKNMGVQADSRYGTFDNFASNNTGISTSILSTTSKQLNYGMGVYMKFPLEDVLNRKNQIKKVNTQLEQAKIMADAQEEELKILVIKQYQELLLKQKLANIQSLVLSNAKVEMDMVEKEFRNGIIPVTEYVRISNIVSMAEADYEKAQSDFLTSKLIIETIAGFTFKNTTPQKQHEIN